MKKVVVYTSPSCPYCVRAKELLKRKNVDFEEKLIGWDDEAGWEEMRKKSNGMKTVPQIYIDDKLVGGYTDLAALDAQGKLEELVK
ncbi:MAG: glutaredoxin 3 [Proteobacteria bacterium]|nr:MAG: glutaredoxin 3 [Pseudomonadota bacterium]